MLEKLLAELRKIMEAMKIYRAMKPEDVKDEDRTAMTANVTRAGELETQIAELRAADELENRMGETINEIPNTDSPGQITIEDQPVYRGSSNSAFGAQLVDVALVTSPGSGAVVDEARSRLEQNTTRALTLIEKRQKEPVSKDFEDRSRSAFNPESRAAGSGQIQGIASEGGFLLQSETSIDLMTNGFNNDEFLKRCQKRTITGSESLEIIGIDETSRADGSRGGGVRVYTDSELGEITSSSTKFNKIKLAPEKLTGMYYASNKILMNATFLGQEMRQLFMEEFAFKGQDLGINGTGAGQALGLANADATISVPKESGQTELTIVSENILNMFQRFYLRGGSGSVVWLANRNAFTQLFTLTYDIGTGGELARLYTPSPVPGGPGTILGYPVVFIEQAETLGTAGDLWLVDLSQYICVDYGNINEASSIHFKFDYDQTTFRFVYHFDGQPRVSSQITPFKDSSAGSTVSPFLNIAVRA